MAYLPSFEFDIFISYAHVDNLPGGRRGWVHRFHKELTDRLDQKLGRVGAARIWWDGDLDGSQVFDRKIEGTVNRAALFIAMTSEGYLNSDYCLKELETFCRKAESEEAGVVVGERARVLNVLLDDIPYDRWPARYGGTNGYHFFDKEKGEPLDLTRSKAAVEMNNMVLVIRDMLKALKGDPPPPEPPGKEPFIVFVADTVTTLKTVRSRVYSELAKLAPEGVRVTDLLPLPRTSREHEEAASDLIKSADLCVHLLDDVPGREIDDEPAKSFLERQAELSLEHAKSQLVWVPSELTASAVEEIEDEPHRRLLQKLADGPRRGGFDYKFVRDRQSAVSQNVLEEIQRLRARREEKLEREKQEREAGPSSRGLARTALIDIHLKDWQYALDISRFLIDHQVVPSVNREEDSPQLNLKTFEEQLRRADLLIIVFGGVPREWVRERLGEALKIVAVSENCPLRACGVYVAPPRKDGASIQFNRGFLPVEVLDNTECFNPQALDSLLAKLQQVGA
jgi:TIR domain